MDGALWAGELGEHLDNVFAEGENVGKIRAQLQRGGIFKETRHHVVIDNGIRFERNGCDCAHKMGVIEQLNIRTVDAELSIVH
jgi:hypothetical protein